MRVDGEMVAMISLHFESPKGKDGRGSRWESDGDVKENLGFFFLNGKVNVFTKENEWERM